VTGRATKTKPDEVPEAGVPTVITGALQLGSVANVGVVESESWVTRAADSMPAKASLVIIAAARATPSSTRRRRVRRLVRAPIAAMRRKAMEARLRARYGPRVRVRGDVYGRDLEWPLC
jgi:hypothetical protein